jgi:hypothetical protein
MGAKRYQITLFSDAGTLKVLGIPGQPFVNGRSSDCGICKIKPEEKR